MEFADGILLDLKFFYWCVGVCEHEVARDMDGSLFVPIIIDVWVRCVLTRLRTDAWDCTRTQIIS